MLIEIHMIQNHSPANMNRDDLGARKTCIFGGVTRARISSQCLKRSIRNPGNEEDVHNRKPGMFAEAMAGHIGIKTKFFPWLVQQALANSEIPKDEHGQIVFAAQRIAASKEKEEKKNSRGAEADPRPKTAQLIHLGPGHAKYYVEKLAELRNTHKECYDYHLNPEVGFREIVHEYLAESALKEEDQKKAVNAAWVIAKCRMEQLIKTLDKFELQTIPEIGEGQPGAEHAKLIAECLTEIQASDPQAFKELVKHPFEDEKTQINQNAPDKPKRGMNEFDNAIKAVLSCDAVDVALFGRMTTSDAFEDVEAAMQVAHAISTHAIVNEVDYFTAVDDLARTVGAGHVDESMFNAACYYKYFCLDWDQLLHNLAPVPQKPKDKKDDSPEMKRWKEDHTKWEKELKHDAEKLAAATLGHFICAVAQTTPSGKQNSFASNCEPCGILVEVKKNGKMPTNYTNAFADPVERIGKPDDDVADEKSWEGRSVACLADHVQSMRKAYGIDSTLLWYSPKLWRFPFRYWIRADDGKKNNAEFVTNQRYDVLEGEYNQDDRKPTGLIAAVVKEATGFNWADVCNAGKSPAKES